MPVEKNKEYKVEIIDNGFEGEGIAKINDFTIFIPGTIKGEIVRILIVKVLSSYAYGKVLEIMEKSEDRQEADCDTYKRCGGCDLRHIKYNKTLEMKQNMVQSLVNKTLKNNIVVKNTIGMEKPYYYRNKLIYPVGTDENGKIYAGIYANRTHTIIKPKECLIQDKESQEIVRTIEKILNKYNITAYDEKNKQGLIRNILIKKGFKTNDILIVFILTKEVLPYEKEIVEELKIKYKNIVSIVKNINSKNTNVVLGDRNINIFGNGFLYDYLEDFKFKISPNSFYQVNPVQAEVLYNIGVKEAGISNKDTVFDLYCGIGTISLFMSKYAKKVYGVEIVKQAIEDAKINAKLNNIENVEFFAGDCEKVVDDLINVKNIIPDIVMVDPPRKGLDNNTVNNLLKIESKKIVYISCNPATMVRDLEKLEGKYEIKFIQPVDMFPFTKHVECVTVLYAKETL